MASLILTAVGTAVGGPIGGALGAVIGRAVDQQVFGLGSREGPRLRELSVTTSSYGQPIPRQFGQLRTAGTIIWSTDLIENKETSGGGKGGGSTTSYSYSVSLAIVVSSTPISAIGRIWADGTLLRGTAGDLKVEGTMRSYLGTGDQNVDPLIEAEQDGTAPAFRDLAYVVFENLDLSSFGNRIPALTFEVFGEQADSASAPVTLKQLAPETVEPMAGNGLEGLLGLSDEGGAIGNLLTSLSAVYPIACATTADGATLGLESTFSETLVELPELLHSTGDEISARTATASDSIPFALRYYDQARDYQPGVQRASTRRHPGREMMVDLPATMAATEARSIVTQQTNRSRWKAGSRLLRIAALDPNMTPGCNVLIPDEQGTWRLKSWEWDEHGIALTLERLSPLSELAVSGDTGGFTEPVDDQPGPTTLKVFEAPPLTNEVIESPMVLAAASAENSAWRGAALYSSSALGLERAGSLGPSRALIGTLVEPLASSPGLMFEPAGEMLVELVAEDLAPLDSTMEGIANGANRVLVGGEVLQFLRATPVSSKQWRLSGLLRGRGATEDLALVGHEAGADVVFLDESLVPLSTSITQSQIADNWVALGLGDRDPATSSLANSGLTTRPAAPVHPQVSRSSDGTLVCTWTRRARGQWLWADSLEVSLVEQEEAYLIGYGGVETPIASWRSSSPRFEMTAETQRSLVAQSGNLVLWVKQIGTHSNSAAVQLTTLT
jgi:hypothetical protein